MVQKQRLTLAPLAPLEPCEGKERDVRPSCRADPSPHHAVVPMLARSEGAGIHRAPAHCWSLPFCPAVPTARCLPGPRGCVSCKRAAPVGSPLLAQAVPAGGTDGWAWACTRPQHCAAAGAAQANQAGGHRDTFPLPSRPCYPHLFSSTSFVTLEMK